MRVGQFENCGHKDNDVTKYTHGIGGNCRMDGSLASNADGFWSTGGFFYVADYGFYIDYSAIDGVVEQVSQLLRFLTSSLRVHANFRAIGLARAKPRALYCGRRDSTWVYSLWQQHPD